MSSSALDGVLRDGRHVMSARVYYEDTDFSGAVYHASYLRYMERGRTNYLRLLRGDDLLVEAQVRVAFVAGGRARPIPKVLRTAMQPDQEAAGRGG